MSTKHECEGPLHKKRKGYKSTKLLKFNVNSVYYFCSLGLPILYLSSACYLHMSFRITGHSSLSFDNVQDIIFITQACKYYISHSTVVKCTVRTEHLFELRLFLETVTFYCYVPRSRCLATPSTNFPKCSST